MSEKRKIGRLYDKEKNNQEFDPYTSFDAVLDSDGNTLTKNLEKFQQKPIEITYQELLNLISNNKLSAGQLYRITDYITTTIQENTTSAGHQFDLIVTADDASHLNCKAKAVQHKDDTYFSNSNLSKWEIWYDINNDTDKYAWADSTNGKGVIYRMVDEWNNDCPYDFKNIQFKRYKTTDDWDSESFTGYYGTDDNSYIKYEINMDVDKTDYKYLYTFTTIEEDYIDTSIAKNNNYVIHDNTIVGSGGDRTPASLPNNVVLREYFINNFIGVNGTGITFGGSNENNYFENGTGSIISNSCSYNKFYNICNNIALAFNCCHNTFYLSSNIYLISKESTNITVLYNNQNIWIGDSSKTPIYNTLICSNVCTSDYSIGAEKFDWSFTNKNYFTIVLRYPNGKIIRMYKANDTLIKVELTEDAYTNLSTKDPNTIYSIIKYDNIVDLGLPSGTWWSTYNIGATAPTDYGNYYSWGETYTKSSYNWNTYSYCNNSSSTSLIKYCTSSTYGTVDNKTSLETLDDASTINWGNDWVTPTNKQLKELYTYCSSNIETVDNIRGLRLTGPNGNSIFIPAGGHMEDGSVNLPNKYGYLLSADLYTSNPSNACIWMFYNSKLYENSLNRCYGFNVRPVLKDSGIDYFYFRGKKYDSLNFYTETTDSEGNKTVDIKTTNTADKSSAHLQISNQGTTWNGTNSILVLDSLIILSSNDSKSLIEVESDRILLDTAKLEINNITTATINDKLVATIDNLLYKVATPIDNIIDINAQTLNTIYKNISATTKVNMSNSLNVEIVMYVKANTTVNLPSGKNIIGSVDGTKDYIISIFNDTIFVGNCDITS